MKKAKYVTIGYSAGAIGMIDAIRKYDAKGGILAVTKEPYLAYGRPAIVDYAMGKIGDEGIIYKGSWFTAKNGVETVLGSSVEKIDVKARALKLSNGDEISYEKLLINTGGKPISPPMPGKELKGVMHFFTLAEAIEMRKQVKENGARTAVVIGGGLIGLKATEALAHLGVKVHMVELAGAILSRSLDPMGSKLMSDKLKSAGVEIYTGTSVKEIYGNGRVRGVRLENGLDIATDLVYISIGVVPDTALAEQSGIQCDKGIVVDRHMKTSAPDVYAAGDAAKGFNFLNGESQVIAIWPVARKMGYYAGLNMLGNDSPYDGSIPMNSLYFEDLYTISYGESNPQDPKDYEIVEKLEKDNMTYRKFVIKDNHVVGAVFVNDISRAGITKGMIYECISVAGMKDKLLRNDFSFVHLPKHYRDGVFTRPFLDLEAQACKI